MATVTHAAPIIRRTAVAMLQVLTTGGSSIRAKGVLSADLDSFIEGRGGAANRKQEAARWLRTLGVPVIANRKAHLTRWFVAPHDSDLHDQWAKRVISDAYAETCRAYCALRPYAAKRSAAKTLKASAYQMGLELGYEDATIAADLTPQSMPASLEAMLTKIGVLADV